MKDLEDKLFDVKDWIPVVGIANMLAKSASKNLKDASTSEWLADYAYRGVNGLYHAATGFALYHVMFGGGK
ncbi:hypothetical protein ACFLZB_02225 [Nanoarchaeota archaeon]